MADKTSGEIKQFIENLKKQMEVKKEKLTFNLRYIDPFSDEAERATRGRRTLGSKIELCKDLLKFIGG